MSTRMAHRRDDGAGQLAHAAQHHHHEGIDDVAAAQVGAHVAQLRQGHAGQSRDARTQPEGQHVHAPGRHAHAVGHAPVLRDGPYEETQPRVVQQHPHQEHDEECEADDHQAVVGQHQAAQHRDPARHPAGVAHFHVLRAE
ncbi:hypothetical protein G6F65_021910 [Rhizopus arrhizus]|nr:hypothetical protein G6F65_021910 [Rhizopus arrhizus]